MQEPQKQKTHCLVNLICDQNNFSKSKIWQFILPIQFKTAMPNTPKLEKIIFPMYVLPTISSTIAQWQSSAICMSEYN